MRNPAATALAGVATAAALALATDGLRAYTSEAVRRLEILRAPRAAPRTLLEDQDGRRFSLDALSGRRLAVAFVYTRCPTVCRRIGSELGALAAALPERAGVTLLSVSFDPERDDPQALRSWASLHGADGERWRVVRPASASELGAWLDRFGIVVIPDGFGGFEHNAALHLVDERGRLVRILDPGAVDEAVRFLAHARERAAGSETLLAQAPGARP